MNDFGFHHEHCVHSHESRNDVVKYLCNNIVKIQLRVAHCRKGILIKYEKQVKMVYALCL